MRAPNARSASPPCPCRPTAVGGALSMPLNRPFDAARQTADSGGWAWVNNPQALLINGRGNWMDCKINAAGQTTPPVVCPVTE